MKQTLTAIFSFLAVYCLASCIAADEIIILLPGKFKGKHLVLAETSYSEISINGGEVVPSKIDAVWWNESVIVTRNFGLVDRKRFPDDTMKKVNRSDIVYYVVDINHDKVYKFSDRDSVMSSVGRIAGESISIALMSLRKAQNKRENELGFDFTPSSVAEYMRNH